MTHDLKRTQINNATVLQTVTINFAKRDFIHNGIRDPSLWFQM